MHYAPPTPEQLEALKQQLGLSSEQMAALFGLATGRQWRRYLSADPNNRREMGAHMLFFAMARLELDEKAINRVLKRMRQIGAVIDLRPVSDEP
ncbi:XRE family transcriptional regulator [Ralstonia pseudosolanacearum]|uniref:XRE family transcriptional regulator n=1 Tax=Ralstonia pseudosolanacearum TaxID=1310165 RepID=UPI003EDF306B